MSSRRITFHAFASVKGGVGKSTLTVVLAKLLAARGRAPVVLDCDLLGTSLADGLTLCAPAKELLADGSEAVVSDARSGFHSHEETAGLRRRRRDAPQDGRWHPVYLNELLDLQAPTRWSDWAWRHVNNDHVRYFPSSSIYREVSRAWHWLYEEPFDWVCKLAWILDAMMDELPELTDIVLDLPPGVVGFSHEAFVMLSFISRSAPLPEGYPPWPRAGVAMTARPYIVATRDENDLLPALELWGRHLAKLPTLVPLVNRDTHGRDAVLQRARAALGPFADLGIDETIRVAPYISELAGLFVTGDVRLSPALDEIARVFDLEVVP